MSSNQHRAEQAGKCPASENKLLGPILPLPVGKCNTVFVAADDLLELVEGILAEEGLVDLVDHVVDNRSQLPPPLENSPLCCHQTPQETTKLDTGRKCKQSIQPENKTHCWADMVNSITASCCTHRSSNGSQRQGCGTGRACENPHAPFWLTKQGVPLSHQFG